MSADPWVPVAAAAIAGWVAEHDCDEQDPADWEGAAEAAVEALRRWCGDAA